MFSRLATYNIIKLLGGDLKLSVPYRDTEENCIEIRDKKQRKNILVQGIKTYSHNMISNPSVEQLIDLSEMVDALSEELGIQKHQLEKLKKKKNKKYGRYSRCFIKRSEL